MSEVEEQAVIVYIDADALSDGILKLDDLYALEDQLEEAIDLAGVGEFDGAEIGSAGPDVPAATICMYGPNAETLFQTVQFVLSDSALSTAARVYLRYGGPEAEGRFVSISEVEDVE